MKFYKQILKYECGPIAILNLLKWLNWKITRKYLTEVKVLCEYKRGQGIDNIGITRALRALKIPYHTKTTKIDHNLMQAVLRYKHGSVILSFMDEPDDDGHALFACDYNSEVARAYRAFKIDQVWFFKRKNAKKSR